MPRNISAVSAKESHVFATGGLPKPIGFLEILGQHWLMSEKTDSVRLAGKLLVAMPGMGDPRFHRSVILMCAHDEDSAMGLIINKPVSDPAKAELSEQISLPVEPDGRERVAVHYGGPVEQARGFVLHSPDYAVDEETLKVDKRFHMTASRQILTDLEEGKGPGVALLALGYSGWGPGQLESEITQNGWLVVDADEDMVFDRDNDTKWERALKKLGIDPRLLSAAGGRA